MNLTMLKDHAQKFASDNATGILTTIGVAGTITTAVLAGRASFKAAGIIEEEKQRRTDPDADVSTVDKVRLVWPQFIAPVASGGVTVTAVIMANRINAQRVAALAAAYSLSENRLKEFQNKVQEKLTGPKNQAVYDEIAQDRIKQNPPSREMLILDGKTVLCYDMFSGRYFNSTHQNIKQAEIATNAEMYQHEYASLSFFYDEIEIDPTGFSDMVGWNAATTGPCELRFSTVMSPDMKPCLAFDFVVAPAHNYSQLF